MSRRHPISDEVLARAREFYEREQLSMTAVAAVLFAEAATTHATIPRLEDGLRRAFRNAGFQLRGLSEAKRLAPRNRTPESYAAVGQRLSKIPPDVLDLATTLYVDERLSVGEVAQAIFAAGMTTHTNVDRLQEGLRRAMRRAGVPMRTTAETLAGRVCRTTEHCAATTQRGRPCGGNVVRDGWCWQHHPDYQQNREALAHMERMRQNRRWVADLVPLAPFVAWLEQRKRELIPPPAQQRFRDRDGSLTRLSVATGVDASTLIKWMSFRNSKGKPKDTITARKVREVLEHDGTTTFEEIYGTEPTRMGAAA